MINRCAGVGSRISRAGLWLSEQSGSGVLLMKKQKAILDPHFRRVENIFAAEDLARLHRVAEVCWGRDEPMPGRPQA